MLVRESVVVGYCDRSYLGEQGSPDGLNILDLRGLDEGLELVGLVNIMSLANCLWFCKSRGLPRDVVEAAGTHSDLNAFIGEDERRVGRSKFGVRHCDGDRWVETDR